MENILVSFLIPVFNSESFLERCIDSIKSVGFSEWEIIAVDDGSDDNSPDLLDNFSKEDHRIKVKHQNNHGISYTRNECLKLAKGKYICFVDSDDWIDRNNFAELHKILIQEAYDIVISPFVFIQDDTTKVLKGSSNVEIEKRSYLSGDWATLWRICFLRELAVTNLVSFPIGIDGGEDYYFCNVLMSLTGKIYYIDKPYYQYNYSNSNSFTHVVSIERINFQIQSTLLLIDKLGDNKLLAQNQQALNRRKFFSKVDLLRYDVHKWKETFPEVNRMYRKFLTGMPLLIFVLRLYNLGYISNIIENGITYIRRCRNYFA